MDRFKLTMEAIDFNASRTPAASYSRSCGHCGCTPGPGEAALLLCGQCRSVHFWSVACQKLAWKAHKKGCKRRAKEAADVTSDAGRAREAASIFMPTSLGELRSPPIASVKAPRQAPLVAGGPDIEAGGGADWSYKAHNIALCAPLHSAIQMADPARTKQLLELGEDIHARDIEGRTPLHEAVREAVREPLPDPLPPGILLMPGAAEFSIDRALQCIDVLLMRGADPNAQDRSGFTPLHLLLNIHLGASGDRLQLLMIIVRKLLAAGADPVLRAQGWGSVTDMAAHYFDAEVKATMLAGEAAAEQRRKRSEGTQEQAGS